LDEDIVFGDALLPGVGLDKGGGPPRLALAPWAIEMVQRHFEYLIREYFHEWGIFTHLKKLAKLSECYPKSAFPGGNLAARDPGFT
jgi:hypothetical protein